MTGIYDYGKLFDRRLNNLRKDKNLSARNRDLIQKFIGDLVLENLSKPRIIKYVDVMRLVCKKIDKDLDKVTKEDLKDFISKTQLRTDCSAWTKHIYRIMIRRFFCWFHNTPKGEYPEIVKWISIRLRTSELKKVTDADILTEDDVQKILDAAKHPRDKAFIATLWESGARIGELGDLQLNKINFDRHGVVINVNGKTGPRPIRLIWSVSYLTTWINNHPTKDDPSSYLWVNIGNTNHGKPMKYFALRKTLYRVMERAGIKKRTNPHLFRHSRATFMADFLTEFQMNKYFGWIQGSKMPSTYVHMSGRNLDDTILSMNGVKEIMKVEEKKLQPQICPRCDFINSHDNIHCNKCSGVLQLHDALALDEQKIKETELRSNADKLMDMLLRDNDVKKLLMEKMGDLHGHRT